MRQLEMELCFNNTDISLKEIFKHSYVVVKSKFPRPIDGETLEEYQQMICDETYLEFAEQIKNKILERQNTAIDTLYRGIKYEKIKE